MTCIFKLAHFQKWYAGCDSYDSKLRKSCKRKIFIFFITMQLAWNCNEIWKIGFDPINRFIPPHCYTCLKLVHAFPTWLFSMIWGDWLCNCWSLRFKISLSYSIVLQLLSRGLMFRIPWDYNWIHAIVWSFKRYRVLLQVKRVGHRWYFLSKWAINPKDLRLTWVVDVVIAW